jgi:hypothetical protein
MRWFSFALLLALACGDDDVSLDSGTPDDAGTVEDAGDGGTTEDAGPPPFEPDVLCPGRAGCEDEGDDALFVGAAMVEITPAFGDDVDILTVDTNGDAIWDPFDGDEFEDRNDNGLFDPVFIAGFGSPRPASGVADPQWARAIVVRQNETTIALVSLDTFSVFLDDTDAIRARVDSALGVDYVATCASHTHQGADTLGIYGLDESSSGVDPEYLERIRDGAARAVEMATANLERARIQYASFDFRDQPGGTYRYVSDARHPRIIDDKALILRFEAVDDDATIATWVNFGAHAEYWGTRNSLLSSDFPHHLREGIEDGVAGPDGELAGLGGMAAYCEGAIGAQIGPGEIRPQTWDGTELPRQGEQTKRVVGEQFAYFVLRALQDGETEETADLGVRSTRFFVDVQNRGFHVAILNQLFLRESFNWDPDRILVPGVNEPDVRTEIAMVDIGRMRILYMPGEVDPALFVGGYDGSFRPDDVPFIDEGVPNSPDVSRAPEGPYLREEVGGGFDYVSLISLGNDQLGYILPDFDYVLDPDEPYIDEAEGEHYEETVSVGIDGWQRLHAQLRLLLEYEP